MAERDPTEGLKRYLATLKRQKAHDYRRFQSAEEHHQFLIDFEEKKGKPTDDDGQNLLVREWFVRRELRMDAKELLLDPGGGYYQFAPLFALPDGTTLVTLLRGDWAAYLIWPVEPHDGHRCYGFRWLSDETARKLSGLNHESIRRHFGFARSRRRRKPPSRPAGEIG